MAQSGRAIFIRTSGVLMIVIASAAALLPLGDHFDAREILGWMLAAGGALELSTAVVRRRHKWVSGIAGGATLLAGLRLLLDPSTGFFEMLNLVILWLVVRSAALGWAALRARDRVRPWFALGAAIDFLLAIGLLAGLPLAYLVVGIFGPTPPVVATFAWVIGLSFVATGALLLATPARESD